MFNLLRWIHSPQAFVDLDNNTSTVYTYDNVSRLTQISDSNLNGVFNSVTGATKPGNTQTFAYDATGNRTSVTATASSPGTGSYSTNALNQYTQAGAEVLLYDTKGNLTIKGLSTSYGYDSKNRLTSMSTVSSVVQMTYDYRNRQVSRTIDGVTTYFLYDGWNLIAEYTNAGPPPPVEYLHGAGIDELILKKGPSGNLVYYHQDGLGSTTALTDFQGMVVETYRYDVFGQVSITDQLGGALNVSFYGNRFLYTGREWIAEIGLYDYRNRVYSAELGRFLQSDPIRFDAGDGNIYRYVSNNPVNATDALGLSSSKCCTFGECFNRCILANGGGWALGALGLAGPFATIRSPIPKAQLGSKNPYTSGFSIAARSVGQRGLAITARRLNPVANVVSVAAGGYLAGLSISCSAMCAADCNSW